MRIQRWRRMREALGRSLAPAILCLAVALLAFGDPPAFAKHLGNRLQWQPETMQAEARLEQSVEIEIIGRATVPAMQMLSEKTGVSLGVAPEDLNTVGERKLTIIAKGPTLKTIMVQIPEALQECHWDIDRSGETPAYLLHRNAGVEAATNQEDQQRRAAAQEARRQRTRESLDDARRALAMSPAELEELEKTDIFLARAASYAPTRSLMEAYVSLPEEDLTQLVDTGVLNLHYSEAPAGLRVAVTGAFQLQHGYVDWARTQPGLPYPDVIAASETQADRLRTQLEAGGDAAIHIRDYGREVGFGPLLQIESDELSFGMMLVPARFSRMTFPGNPYEWLLMATGDTTEEARRVTDNSMHEWVRMRDAREWDESSWVEPADPRLHEVVELPANSDQVIALSRAQQAISDRTGLSVISDYFTDDTIGPSPNQPALGGPLWHDLYVLGKLGQFAWQQSGDCLVFHRTNWYWRAQFELPESLIADYRGRLARQGHLTLADVAELASVLASRPAAGMRGGFNLPRDLGEAGAQQAVYPYSRSALLLWRALSPDERAAAEGEQGLRFADLTDGRAAALARIIWPPRDSFDDARTPEDRIRDSVFRVRRSEGVDEQGRYTRYDLAVEFGDASREPLTVAVVLHEAKARSGAKARTTEDQR